MRMVFGIVALLVAVGIGLYIWSLSAESSVGAKKKAEQQIEHMTQNPSGSGNAPAGASDKITYQLDPKGMSVTNIGPANPMALRYDLRAGDVIVQAGDVALRGEDDKSAQAFIDQAYLYKRELVVERGGEKLKLPFRN